MTKLVDELIPVDRILQRWAVSVGDGIYDQPWDFIPQSKVPVLDDQTAIVVDQLVLRSPVMTRKLVELWYRTPVPRVVLARKISVDPDGLDLHWNAALHYFRRRFTDSPLSNLRRMVAMDVAGRTTTVYKTYLVDWARCPKNTSAG
jgi:hypothetical protein